MERPVVEYKSYAAFLVAGLEAVCGRGGQEGGEDAAEEADQGSGRQVRSDGTEICKALS